MGYRPYMNGIFQILYINKIYLEFKIYFEYIYLNH